MNQRVRINVGFAEGLEAVAVDCHADGLAYSVNITYPEGFYDGFDDLSGRTEGLTYEFYELTFLDSE